MHPSEAILWFSDVTLSGWNGSDWTAGIAKGDFHSYDRFITEREFGATKRIFLAHQHLLFDPTTYPVVRTADGLIWIVESMNEDYGVDVAAYQKSFLLVRASGTAEIYSTSTTPRASGAAGSPTPSLEATTWTKVSRYGGTDSDEIPDVRRSLFELTIPGGIDVSPEWYVESDGETYEIEEVFPVLLSTRLRCRRAN